MTPAPAWPAPLATGPLDALVDVPGSKSLTNRHLLLGALAETPSTVRGALHSRDGILMVDALRALGIAVETTTDGCAPGVWDVRLRPGPLRGGAVDAGLAGTVMRFVPPLAVLADGTVTLDGDERARERPVAPVVDALRALGADIDAACSPAGEPVLPLTIRGTGSFTGGTARIDASGSSQFVSGLLLSAAAWERGIDLRHTGARVPSMPHVDMTVDVLRARGVTVTEYADDDAPLGADARAAGARPARWVVAPGPVAGGEVTVEPDLSNAGPFLAAAMVAGGTVRVPRWPAGTTQPGDALREIFTRMGASVTVDGAGTLTMTGPGAAGLRPIDADLGEVGELTPTVAAVCAVAPGTSRLSGVAHLRTHETDRLAALATEITRVGGACRETADGLAIEGRAPAELHGAVLETYADHRMATFAAILGLVVPGVEVVDVATADKTLPHFPQRWAAMLAGGPITLDAGEPR